MKRTVRKGLMTEKAARKGKKISFPTGFSPTVVFKMGERLKKIIEKNELTDEEKIYVQYAAAVAEFRKSIITKKNGVNTIERVRKLDSEMHKYLSEQEIRHLNLFFTVLSTNDPETFEELYQKLLKRKIDSS